MRTFLLALMGLCSVSWAVEAPTPIAPTEADEPYDVMQLPFGFRAVELEYEGKAVVLLWVNQVQLTPNSELLVVQQQTGGLPVVRHFDIHDQAIMVREMTPDELNTHEPIGVAP